MERRSCVHDGMIMPARHLPTASLRPQAGFGLLRGLLGALIRQRVAPARLVKVDRGGCEAGVIDRSCGFHQPLVRLHWSILRFLSLGQRLDPARAASAALAY